MRPHKRMPWEGPFTANFRIGTFVDRVSPEGGVHWDLWHWGLVGRPWSPFDHALDAYGHFCDPEYDDYSEESNPYEGGQHQAVRERI